MGQQQSGFGGKGNERGGGDADKEKKKKYEAPIPSRIGKRKKGSKGPDTASKLPAITPHARCRLKLLKSERIKDYLLMEQEFIQNQERLKPQEERQEEERTKVDELRGTPMAVGSLEEIIDDQHAIVSTVRVFPLTLLASSKMCFQNVGSEHYVNIMSFVDKEQLEPGCAVLLNHKNHAVIGVLADDADPMVSVMKLEKAPQETYADVGVILYGCPGTGKTLLAKAVANQTSATFLRISIVFIDEIDAVGTKRYDSNSGGEREIQRTMLELLNQLDGFDSRGDVKVLMATNRIESLDPALIRPGRIDRKIEFPLPDEKTKRRIFQIHTSRMTLSDDVNLEEFILAKDELSGADIKAMCTEAGLLALRERRMRVTMEDFQKSKENVLYRKKEGAPEELYL
ncbi:unnamed protein product [Strongylus vulgaris]|uniref:AAA+ ATPase domain-containing protein n=1 Tax=Strongylus vulgaris TaxID=40348 RepID=A0A3P7LC21_STRVU|nr:unnamed protein product [Strongylus vulgaris]